MNEIKLFEFEESSIRVMIEDGEPLFLAKDIAEILGYARPKDAISAHCKGAVKRSLLTSGGMQEATFIPERDVYRLIMRSNLPKAQEFEEKVVGEILPSIRRTGMYVPREFTRLELIDMARDSEMGRLEAEKQLALAAPKVEAFDSFIDANGSHSIKTIAKMLGTGEKRLFNFLRENNILMTNGSRRNLPYQRYIDNGCFVVKESPFHLGDSNTMYAQTRVLPKGIDFIRLLMKREAA